MCYSRYIGRWCTCISTEKRGPREDQLKRVQRTFYYAAGSRADSSRAYIITTVIIIREGIREHNGNNVHWLYSACTVLSTIITIIIIIRSSICRNAYLDYIELCTIRIRFYVCFPPSIRRYLRFKYVTTMYTPGVKCTYSIFEGCIKIL